MFQYCIYLIKYDETKTLRVLVKQAKVKQRFRMRLSSYFQEIANRERPNES